tara:strand:+ start:740 stop:964 length:225 start_codon:yes stop_codon:yes gene_type:complete
MSEFIFFTLGCAIGCIFGAIHGIYSLHVKTLSQPSDKFDDLDEILKDGLGSIPDDEYIQSIVSDLYDAKDNQLH